LGRPGRGTFGIRPRPDILETVIPAPVYHITHWKAGSQWVRGVLEDACGAEFMSGASELQARALQPSCGPAQVYSPLYLTRGIFEGSAAAREKHRKFVVVRDLRDTLVSWYFSLRYTHEANTAVGGHRQRLSEATTEEGLLYLIHHADFASLCSIPASWLGAPDLSLRYEELIEDPHACFARIFEYCGIGAPGERRRFAVERWTFENMASRRRGEELRSSHMRKGIAGDWRNHFTPAVADAFKRRYGDLLVRLGYERDGGW
jgi:hypothetical protein